MNNNDIGVLLDLFTERSKKGSKEERSIALYALEILKIGKNDKEAFDEKDYLSVESMHIFFSCAPFAEVKKRIPDVNEQNYHEKQLDYLRRAFREIQVELFLLSNSVSNYNDNDDKQIDGVDYEIMCVSYFKNAGYSDVSHTGKSGDQGIDIIAYKNGLKYGIQCKYYSGPVSNKAIQEAYSGAKYYGCDKSLVITNSIFTQSAQELALNTGVILMGNMSPANLAIESTSEIQKHREDYIEVIDATKYDKLLERSLKVIRQFGKACPELLTKCLNISQSRSISILGQLLELFFITNSYGVFYDVIVGDVIFENDLIYVYENPNNDMYQYLKNEFIVKDGVLEEYNGDGQNVFFSDDIVAIGKNAFHNRIEYIKFPFGINIDKDAFTKCECIDEAVFEFGINAEEIEALKKVNIMKMTADISPDERNINLLCDCKIRELYSNCFTDCNLDIFINSNIDIIHFEHIFSVNPIRGFQLKNTKHFYCDDESSENKILTKLLLPSITYKYGDNTIFVGNVDIKEYLREHISVKMSNVYGSVINSGTEQSRSINMIDYEIYNDDEMVYKIEKLNLEIKPSEQDKKGLNEIVLEKMDEKWITNVSQHVFVAVKEKNEKKVFQKKLNDLIGNNLLGCMLAFIMFFVTLLHPGKLVLIMTLVIFVYCMIGVIGKKYKLLGAMGLFLSGLEILLNLTLILSE